MLLPARVRTALAVFSGERSWRTGGCCCRSAASVGGSAVGGSLVGGSPSAKRPRRSSRRDENGDIATAPETGMNAAVQTSSRTAVGTCEREHLHLVNLGWPLGAAAQSTSKSPQTRLHLSRLYGRVRRTGTSPFAARRHKNGYRAREVVRPRSIRGSASPPALTPGDAASEPEGTDGESSTTRPLSLSATNTSSVASTAIPSGC